MKKILTALLILLILVGCSSSGNSTFEGDTIDLNNDDMAMWDKGTLEEGTLIEANQSVKMSIMEITEDIIKIKLLNQSCWDCGYAQYYDVHVLIDDIWYNIPALTTYEEKPAYGYILEGYTTHVLDYDVKEKYGVLPEGHYRIVVEGHTCEFVVK